MAQDFLAQLHYCEEDSIVVVGHSHYFREIFKEFICDEFATKDPELTKGLQKLKLQNAGCAKVVVDYSTGHKMIETVELLFGTELVK